MWNDICTLRTGGEIFWGSSEGKSGIDAGADRSEFCDFRSERIAADTSVGGDFLDDQGYDEG